MLLKPNIWNVSPALAAPEWRWFWEGVPLFMALPWQVPSLVRDREGDTLASSGTVSERITDFGSYNHIAAGGYYERDGFPTLSYPFTIIGLFYGDLLSSNTNEIFVSLVDSTVNNKLMGILKNRSPGVREFQVFIANPTFFETNVAVAAAEHLHVLQAGVFASATSRFTYVLGKSSAEDTNSASLFQPNRVSIGRLGDTTPSSSGNDMGIYWAAILPFAMTLDQFLQLERDPFGPFRMEDRSMLFAIPPADGGDSGGGDLVFLFSAAVAVAVAGDCRFTITSAGYMLPEDDNGGKIACALEQQLSLR